MKAREAAEQIGQRTGWRWRSGPDLERMVGRTDKPGIGWHRSYSHGDVEAAVFWLRAGEWFNETRGIDPRRPIVGYRSEAREHVRAHCVPGWVVFTSTGWRHAVSLPNPDTFIAIPVHERCG